MAQAFFPIGRSLLTKLLLDLTSSFGSTHSLGMRYGHCVCLHVSARAQKYQI
jgi:hypothetical protein